MLLFHRYPTATIADVFHRRQFILADVPGFHFRRPAETAFFLVIAWIAQMSRGFGHRTAILTCVSHNRSPFINWVDIDPTMMPYLLMSKCFIWHGLQNVATFLLESPPLLADGSTQKIKKEWV
jgi:hypothetical protein